MSLPPPTAPFPKRSSQASLRIIEYGILVLAPLTVLGVAVCELQGEVEVWATQGRAGQPTRGAGMPAVCRPLAPQHAKTPPPAPTSP